MTLYPKKIRELCLEKISHTEYVWSDLLKKRTVDYSLPILAERELSDAFVTGYTKNRFAEYHKLTIRALINR